MSDGLTESIGLDLKSLLAGFLGGRLAATGSEGAPTVINIRTDSEGNDAPVLPEE